MAKLLFSLRGVPADEAAEVRELLTHQSIDFYETDSGNWGISMPALWVDDDKTYAIARQLIDRYQHQRYTEQHALYEQKKRLGQQQTFLQHLLERPLEILFSLTFIGLIVYVSIRLLKELGL